MNPLKRKNTYAEEPSPKKPRTNPLNKCYLPSEIICYIFSMLSIRRQAKFLTLATPIKYLLKNFTIYKIEDNYKIYNRLEKEQKIKNISENTKWWASRVKQVTVDTLSYQKTSMTRQVKNISNFLMSGFLPNLKILNFQFEPLESLASPLRAIIKNLSKEKTYNQALSSKIRHIILNYDVDTSQDLDIFINKVADLCHIFKQVNKIELCPLFAVEKEYMLKCAEDYVSHNLLTGTLFSLLKEKKIQGICKDSGMLYEDGDAYLLENQEDINCMEEEFGISLLMGLAIEEK